MLSLNINNINDTRKNDDDEYNTKTELKKEQSSHTMTNIQTMTLDKKIEAGKNKINLKKVAAKIREIQF